MGIISQYQLYTISMDLLRYFLNLRFLHTYCGYWKISPTSLDVWAPWFPRGLTRKGLQSLQLPAASHPPPRTPSFIDVRPCCFCCVASRRTPRALRPQQQSLVTHSSASEFMFSGPYTWQKGLSFQPTHSCFEERRAKTLKLPAVQKLRKRIENNKQKKKKNVG
jgi:hypothetical protein